MMEVSLTGLIKIVVVVMHEVQELCMTPLLVKSMREPPGTRLVVVHRNIPLRAMHTPYSFVLTVLTTRSSSLIHVATIFPVDTVIPLFPHLGTGSKPTLRYENGCIDTTKSPDTTYMLNNCNQILISSQGPSRCIMKAMSGEG